MKALFDVLALATVLLGALLVLALFVLALGYLILAGQDVWAEVLSR